MPVAVAPPPRPSTPERFWGASIRLFQADVLLVYVSLAIVRDPLEASLVVAAFHARFGRTIALAAQAADGTPTYFGPGPIAQVLAQIPFDALGWKRYRYALPKPPMLPIPVDPPCECESSYVRTAIRDRETAMFLHGTPAGRETGRDHGGE